ncbi:MAG TPA: orotidine-5'-phosphate decarboxylase [Gemmatimonadaceae bacterium]|nr:orotidine-5'-phosphate decarboxylase [Gemmatimonadaceae bacterium]
MANTVRTTPIIALDVPTADAAMRVVESLGDRCRFYKIGSELFTAAGPNIVTRVRDAGCRVFLDLKLYDIPNTVRGAARSAARLGVRLLTVHASGGVPMIEAAVEGGGDATSILAVTVLTSFDDASLKDATGRPEVVASNEVVRLADLASRARAHGIVCSGAEAAAVRAKFADTLAVLVPGIRMAGSAAHDQRRVVTPAEASAAGARYIVVGRAVTAAPDPRAAMDLVLSELQSVAV